MKRFLLIATACILALVVSSDVALSAGKGGSRGGSRGSVSRGNANRGSAARSTANRGGSRGGAAKHTAGKGSVAKGGKSTAGKGGTAKTNAAKGSKGTAAKGGKGNLAKGGKGTAAKGGRTMPRSVQGRALPRNHAFGRSLFSARFGMTLWADGDESWYYWYAPFDSYLPVDFIDLYTPDDSASVTVTTDDAV
jgi:hypothetical protein